MGDYKAIGKAFIEFYYNKFDTGPRDGVAALYVRRSVLLHEAILCINLFYNTYRNQALA